MLVIFLFLLQTCLHECNGYGCCRPPVVVASLVTTKPPTTTTTTTHPPPHCHRRPVVFAHGTHDDATCALFDLFIFVYILRNAGWHIFRPVFPPIYCCTIATVCVYVSRMCVCIFKSRVRGNASRAHVMMENSFFFCAQLDYDNGCK